MKNEQASRDMLICGIDEAGRGPLAGPVCAAAVVLGEYNNNFLNDSKKLSPSKREKLEQQIKENALAYGIGWASCEEIDEINILQASLLAMKRAFFEMIKKLPIDVKLSVIIDGNKTPDLSAPAQNKFAALVKCEAMVKADAKVPEVMAASILAKTARDSYMDEMAKLYPEYGYEKHKGYPVKAHRDAVKKYGPSPIQRKSFTVK